MKIFKNIICFLCISIGFLTLSVRAAVVTDNDASSYVTKAEFEAYKNNFQKMIDDYNENLGSAIDGSIATYLATFDTSGGSDLILEQVFPIGFIILSNQAPTYGTWQEITDTTGRCLWVDSTKTWGTTIAQAMPYPTWTMTSPGNHGHTFSGTNVYTWISGEHSHTNSTTGWYGRDYAANMWKEAGTGSSYGNTAISNYTKSHSAHTHSITGSGTIGENTNHKHTVTVGGTDYTGAVNSKVQPLAYVIRMWKRIA